MNSRWMLLYGKLKLAVIIVVSNSMFAKWRYFEPVYWHSGRGKKKNNQQPIFKTLAKDMKWNCKPRIFWPQAVDPLYSNLFSLQCCLCPLLVCTYVWMWFLEGNGPSKCGLLVLVSISVHLCLGSMRWDACELWAERSSIRIKRLFWWRR